MPPLRLGSGIGVPFFSANGPGWNPSLAGWKNYGDMTDPSQLSLLFANNNYTGAPTNGNAVQSIATGLYGTRGLRETALTGPLYTASVSVGTYTGPALYYGGGHRLLADDVNFSDFGSHSAMMFGAFRGGPTSGAIWTKGGNGDARGTVFLNTTEFRLFNTNDQGTFSFLGSSYTLESLEFTYDHGTGVSTLWRNNSVLYSGTGPGQDGGRLYCVGQGSGGFSCADFYCFKWAFKTGLMTETERLSQRAYWGLT